MKIIMKPLFLVIGASLMALVLCSAAAAQMLPETGELALKRYFEGKKIIVKLDMPATKSGVDLYPDRTDKLFDLEKHLKRNRDNGVAIPNGGQTMITKIEFDKKTIEVHLDGGGFGSSDDWQRVGAEPTYPTSIPKTQREIDLEKQITTETDKKKLQYLKDELSYERKRRDEGDRRNRHRYDDAVRERNDRIAYERPRRGSRFNLVYKNTDPKTLTAQDIIRDLEKYVDFSGVEGVRQ